MDLDTNFNNAINKIKTVKTLSNDNMLKLYGYYKQATFGDINISKPSFWDRKGVAKWNAWDYCKDMTKEDAKKNYVNFVNLLIKE